MADKKAETAADRSRKPGLLSYCSPPFWMSSKASTEQNTESLEGDAVLAVEQFKEIVAALTLQPRHNHADR